MKIKLITSIIIILFSIAAYSEQVPSSINTTQSISKNKTSECIFPTKTKIPEYSSKMTTKEKKQRFKDIVLPSVNTVYCELEHSYSQLLTAISLGDTSAYNDLKKTYRVSTDEELLMAIKPHPRSIAMAQAAMESAWATSRFTIKANNLFGVWSFNKGEPRIAAEQKRGRKTIWLKKYSSVEVSVRDYYKTLSRSYAFAEFRKTKIITNNPYILVTKLDSYSEKKAAYGIELASIIKFNKYFKLDE